MVIKNILWDVDGVLANLNHAYYSFCKNHPQFKDAFKQYEYKDLPLMLPIDKEKYGAMELSTHPTLGKQLNEVFCASNDYYFDRPLYPNTAEICKEFNELGYVQMTMSAGFDMTKKMDLLHRCLYSQGLNFIILKAVEHDKVVQADGSKAEVQHGKTKEQKIINALKECKLKPRETVLVDDRIYNLYSGLNAGVKVVRFMSEFTTPSPDDLQKLPHVHNIWEFRQWLFDYNKKSKKRAAARKTSKKKK
ncbi:MAG: hypothetical protein Ta2D_03790 [Rickettsiales bacterium]|nr:MAG: hypothetical protein Ta2D_03790 [Rickettsiales bacterium]